MTDKEMQMAIHGLKWEELVETWMRRKDKDIEDVWGQGKFFEYAIIRAFVNQLYAAIKGNPHNMVAFYELGKYRLNKKIPNTLSFEERKDRLINSEEWKGWINQNNKHLAPENITADNIQSEIDTVGIRCGMEIMKRYKNKWVPMAISGMCRVYIPE